MKYTFTGEVFRQGNRHFIEVPFDVWEECGQKGLVPVKVSIEDLAFECRLVPKGNGRYYIPIKKDALNGIANTQEVGVSLEIIDGLTRINHDSPYTKENPIRIIDGIQNVTYPKAGYCGQTCIAMLTGLGVDEVIEIMQSKAGQCSFSKLIETLDYYGISHDDRMTYVKGKEIVLPKCCIATIRGEPKNYFALYYDGKFYGTASIDPESIIGYLGVRVQ